MSRKRLLLVVLATLGLGFAVIALNPDYRDTLRGLLRNRPGETPIWRTNERFYEGIEAREGSAPREGRGESPMARP